MTELSSSRVHAHEPATASHSAGPSPVPAEEYWEDFYRGHDAIWSGRPNPLLVREVTPLTPGVALDLGCGEGADAVWLARRGWRVTAVDVSQTALDRAAAHAAEAGVGDRVTWARHDLGRTFPTGSFDLVSAQFLHSPVAAEQERQAILRGAAGVVSVGGVLLIVSHAGWPSWVEVPPFDFRFPTTAEILDTLALSSDRWQVETEDLVERELTGPDGHSGRRGDTVLRIRRTG